MIGTLVVLGVGAFAAVAFLVSLISAAVLQLGRGVLARLTPKAHRRVVLAAALLPWVVSSASLLAAFSPSIGWIKDNCDPLGSPHGHPHICTDHATAGLPALSVFVLGSVLVTRVFAAMLAGSWAVIRGWRGAKTLSELAGDERVLSGAWVLPLAPPQAFSVGIWRPRIFVTRGMIERYPEHLQVVLAHERAHVRSADSFWRELVRFAAAFHLPGIGGGLRSAVKRAQEMVADEVAATEVGDRASVARALVDLARHPHRSSHASVSAAFVDSDVEARVTRLLRDEPGFDAPTRPVLLVALTACLMCIALFAGSVHHAVEVLLGVLGA